jgi:hypothetical protein
VAGRGRDHDVVAADIREQGVERLAHDELHADRRREVEARVDLRHPAVDELAVDDAPLHELHGLQLEQVLDVLEPARAQVVQQNETVPARGERVGEVGPDESRSSGDEISHAAISPLRHYVVCRLVCGCS